MNARRPGVAKKITPKLASLPPTKGKRKSTRASLAKLSPSKPRFCFDAEGSWSEEGGDSVTTRVVNGELAILERSDGLLEREGIM